MSVYICSGKMKLDRWRIRWIILPIRCKRKLVDSLQKLAAGDLTFEVTPRDDQDVLRGSLKQLGNDLNEIMAQIQVAG